eukprot:TRINITY_DN1239_c0_g1_i1.p1 TRINITY_DN1239_c0_g1~~TRINITY_DN1239_c0_g1_i1.p1  ORF type:complete len:738 (-),score=252.05 TRINITY_DN1239_c0_g1_i1:94-2172(-)
MSEKRKQVDASAEKNKMKRANTMQATAEEAASLGFEVSTTAGPETRSQRAAKSTFIGMFDQKPKSAKTTPELIAQLKMAFRVYDKDRSGSLDKDELADVMRSLGKRPLKKKIDAIFAEATGDATSKSITLTQFINYMQKKYARKTAGSTAASTTTTASTTTSTATTTSAPTTTTASTTATTTVTSSTTATSASTNASTSTSSAASRGLTRKASLANFYTEHAGLTTEISGAPTDAFANPQGRSYDLGIEGAFTAFTISLFTPPVIGASWSNLEAALKSKGFKLKLTENIKVWAASLASDEVDEAWFISDMSNIPADSLKGIIESVQNFHKKGKGLFFWGDNEPWQAKTNQVLKELFGFGLIGNDDGQKVLEVHSGGGSPANKTFLPHLLTTGIVKLYEGHTICFPDKPTPGFQVLANNSSGHPCMLYKEAENGNGRVAIDCGYTKLYLNWDTAGTERYVLNAAVWLLHLEKKVLEVNEGKSVTDTHVEMVAPGEVYLLEGSLGKIMFGLGWDTHFDLDAHLFVYKDKETKPCSVVNYQRLQDQTLQIKHSGDIMNAKNHTSKLLSVDDEQITLTLKTLPAEITTLIFTVLVFTSNQSLKDVAGFFVRVVDMETMHERVMYRIGRANNPKSTGLVMCKLSKTQTGDWELTSIGEDLPVPVRSAWDDIATHLVKYLDPKYVPAGAKNNPKLQLT